MIYLHDAMVNWVAHFRLPPEVYWKLNPDELAAFHRRMEFDRQADK